MTRNTVLRTPATSTARRRVLALAGAACATVALAGGMLGFAPQQAHAGVVAGVGIPELQLLQEVYAPRTVTVTGTDSVSVAPDAADLSLAVRTESADAATCQDQAAQTVDAVTAALVAFGVPEEDIVTSDVNLYPQYDYSTQVETIVGYQMYVGITVRGLAVDQVGDVVSTATAAGANVVNNVSYYCSDYDAQYQQALLLAIEQAHAKAEAVAGATGAELGDPVSVTEGFDGQQYRLTNNVAYAADEAATADAAGGSSQLKLDIDPGTIEIEASVTVEYRVVSGELADLLASGEAAYADDASVETETVDAATSAPAGENAADTDEATDKGEAGIE